MGKNVHKTLSGGTSDFYNVLNILSYIRSKELGNFLKQHVRTVKKNKKT